MTEISKPVPLAERVPQDIRQELNTIGLEFSGNRKIRLYQNTRRRLRSGLDRKGILVLNNSGMGNDGGLPAFKTEIKPLNREHFSTIPDESVYIASIGGTNSTFSTVSLSTTGEWADRQRQADVHKFGERKYDNDEDKKQTFAQFVANAVDPIFEHYEKFGGNGPLRIGISLAFPHDPVDNGTDIILGANEHGILAKAWQMTNWNELKDEDKRFVQAIKRYAEERRRGNGTTIDPKDIDVVILNDAPATMLDLHAQTKTTATILGIGGITGTGMNLALEYDGQLINTEIGRLPLDETVDPITKRMLTNLAALNGDPELSPELEHLIGGKYAIERVIAAIQILGEKRTANTDELVTYIRDHHTENPGFISEIANGKAGLEPTVQYLAQLTLQQAGQALGIAIAGALDERYQAEPYRNDTETTFAIPMEGSFVHHGVGVKDALLKQLADLQHPKIEIIEADSKIGLALQLLRPDRERIVFDASQN